jgi:hypothetical protein
LLKEKAFLEGEGKNDEVIAALVTSVEKESAKVRVGDQEGVIPLEQAAWARKPNPELNSEYTKITTLRPVLSAGDVVLVRATEKQGIWALDQDPKLQGALISTDPNSGYVVAMIGGYDFEKSEFNRAFQACRQPGSAFKPVIYSAAIEQRAFRSPPSCRRAHASPTTTPPGGGGSRRTTRRVQGIAGAPGFPPLDEHASHPHCRPWASRCVGLGAVGISTKINEDLSVALGSSCALSVS